MEWMAMRVTAGGGEMARFGGRGAAVALKFGAFGGAKIAHAGEFSAHIGEAAPGSCSARSYVSSSIHVQGTPVPCLRFNPCDDDTPSRFSRAATFLATTGWMPAAASEILPCHSGSVASFGRRA